MDDKIIAPHRAEFSCGPYDDGSGFHVVVSYDLTDSGRFQHYIRLDGFAVSFPYEHAQQVIDAIRFCARAIEVHAKD